MNKPYYEFDTMAWPSHLRAFELACDIDSGVIPEADQGPYLVSVARAYHRLITMPERERRPIIAQLRHQAALERQGQ